MTADDLTTYLHREIPLTAAMGVTVAHYDGHRVRLSAPLAANRNPHGTAFAGSQSILGILAGWTLLYARLQEAGLAAALVIRESRFSYRRPLRGELWAEAKVTEATFAKFCDDFRGGGRARLTMEAIVGDDDGPCGRHKGVFVALGGGGN